MPVLHKSAVSRLVVYAGDHLLPHVHVQISDGRECTVELGSLRIVGRVNARELSQELQWIEWNEAELRLHWGRLNP